MADRLTPDLVTLGKPMGNGYPVAAVIGRSAVIDPFMASTDYFSTYGGGTVACVAALAVLHAIGAEGIVTNARTTGAHLLGSLTELVGRYDAIAACRGWGLAIGVDIVGDEGQADAALTSSIVNAMRDAGVLIGTTGPLDSTLKIRPPLVIQPADCDLLVDTLDQVLSAGS
jgi:4-aminobutyrate aminotransferase-like enzyme